MMAGVRAGLLSEIFVMSWDTLRGNKMRSALTVLGVVIGITSIVGTTSLLRGFDQSLRDSIGQLGPDTIIVQKWGALSLIGGGKSFLDVARRPNLTKDDAEAIQRDCPSVAILDVWLGATGFSASRIYYGHERTRQVGILGATENWSAVNFAKVEAGRVFSQDENEHRRPVVLLGNSPWKALFPNTDPIGKTVRIGQIQFTVIGVLGPRPSRATRRRRRFRDHSLRHARNAVRKPPEGLGQDHRRSVQSGRGPHGDDRRGPARRPA